MRRMQLHVLLDSRSFLRKETIPGPIVEQNDGRTTFVLRGGVWRMSACHHLIVLDLARDSCM